MTNATEPVGVSQVLPAYHTTTIKWAASKIGSVIAVVMAAPLFKDPVLN